MRKEVGGYLELEHFTGELFHKDALALNSGRGCLGYLTALRNIKKIWVPDFLCSSVASYLKKSNVEILRYQITKNFLPDYDSFSVNENEWMLLVDYYGQLNANDVSFAIDYSNARLIVDETQGFYRRPWNGADTFYSCRKWFGVADGAYLYSCDKAKLEASLGRDSSYARMGYVLGRFERSAQEFYSQASSNNDFFDDEPAKLMSPITDNILRGIDYQLTLKRRLQNWTVLSKCLDSYNCFHPKTPESPFMYPLYLGPDKAPQVRSALIKRNIYIPVLWPNVVQTEDRQTWAYKYAQGIIPLPIDQRYDKDDMDYIAHEVLNIIEEISEE